MKFLPLILLLAGCAVGPYADRPEYAVPSTRSVAARHLNEALAFGGRGVSEVAVDEVRMTWHERRQLSDKRWVMLERELHFQELLTVKRPVRPGEWWQLEVAASGGKLTFQFDDVENASKAEAAFRRLLPALSTTEKRRLFEKYVVILEGGVARYVKDANGTPQPNPESASIESAVEFLKALTGENFGEDTQAWRKYGLDTFPAEP